MSKADELRAKAAAERTGAPHWNGTDSAEQCAYLRATLYECTAALIESLPSERERAVPSSVGPERLAQMIAHRVCCGTESDPSNGKLHGYCVICGVPWPCDYVGPVPALLKSREVGS